MFLINCCENEEFNINKCVFYVHSPSSEFYDILLSNFDAHSIRFLFDFLKEYDFVYSINDDFKNDFLMMLFKKFYKKDLVNIINQRRNIDNSFYEGFYLQTL